MKKIFAVICLLLFTYSVSASAQAWKYRPILDPSSDPNLIALAKGETPRVIFATIGVDYQQKVLTLKNSGYTRIGFYMGHPDFKRKKNEKRAVSAAKKAGASVIFTSDFGGLIYFYALQRSAPQSPVKSVTLKPTPPVVQPVTTSPSNNYAAEAKAQENPFATKAPSNPFAVALAEGYVGIFNSDAVRLTLARTANGFSGSLFYAQTAQTYPVTAGIENGVLRGSFTTGGKAFPFTFQLDDDGNSAQFNTEGYSGKLERTLELSAPVKTSPPLSRIDKLYEEALVALESATSAQKSVAMATTIAQLAQGGRMERARALLDAIPRNDTFRDLATAMFGESQAASGDLVGAKATANGMASQTWRTYIVEAIAVYQAENGDAAAALSTANSIGTQNDKISALVAVANALSQSDDKAIALTTLKDAQTRAEAVQDKSRKDDALAMVSGGYAIAGNYDMATDLGGDIKNHMARVKAYVSIALAQAKAGDVDGARKSIKRAEGRSGHIKPKAARPAAYAQIARGYAALRDVKGMTKMFKWTKILKGNDLKARVEIVRTQIDFGYYAPARTNLSLIGSADLIGSLTAELAQHQAQNGDFEGGLSMAQSIIPPHHRAFGIAAVATEMAKAE